MRKQLYFKEEILNHPERVWPEIGDIRDFPTWFANRYHKTPLHLELGMGKGDFLIAMAEQHPDEFFIGVEIKEERVYYANRTASEKDLKNILFLQVPVQDLLEYDLPKVHCIYLLFSDPWPKARHEKRRLSSESFLHLYEKLLLPEGELIMKTDDDGLYAYSIESFQENQWKLLEQHDHFLTEEQYQTDYEQKWLSMGKSVGYLKAKPLR